MRFLILGGYGVFGGRLAELLSDLGAVEMLICGRSLTRATRFCDAFQGAATVTALQLDRLALGDHIEALKPDLVIDASGPFQDYGDARYSVIETCIRFGVNYLDFADAADFVSGVAEFDPAAREAGIFVLSGVSSFPVLTAAVLREMSKSMEITSVTGGIAPSPYAGVGLNVMRAVVGYAGGPVKLTRDGAKTTAPGLAETMRYTIAVPGRLPLGNIHFSLVDVPDLQVLPSEYPGLTDIWIGAGPVPEILHRLLNMLALARARLGLPGFAALAPLFYKILNVMKFGEHRGGMFVHVKGHAGGAQVERAWHLLAEGDDGPYIPSMAAEAIVRKLIKGIEPEVGARAAVHELTLDDYAGLFAGRDIHMGVWDEPAQDAPLYRRALGDAFDALPAQIRAIHDETGDSVWKGLARVRRGKGVLARIVARAFGFPEAGDQVPVEVHFERRDGQERWERRFGAGRFSSLQWLGRGRNARLLMEQFGPFRVALALVAQDGKLHLVPRRWSLLGLPLPKSLLPSGASFEAEVDGRFQFDVEISAPVIGLIVAYQGVLASA